jgi:hypothetical protein
MGIGSTSWLLDHLDSKQLLVTLVIANLVGLLLALMLLFFA